MQNKPQRSRLEQSAIYRIKVQGRLNASWTEWFNGMTVTASHEDNGITVTILTGLVVDQVALHGLLVRIRDLGLPLLSVECMEAGGE